MLPRIVYRMCVGGALIVGSRALVLSGALSEKDANPKDYDLLVPYEKWQHVSTLIPENATLNKFGGWRFETLNHDGELVEVDVWPSTIVTYLQECKSKHSVPVCVVDYIANRVYTSKIMELKE